MNSQIKHAEKRVGTALEAVLVLGDVGLFSSELKRFFRRRGGRFARPVFYIEGNHEDHQSLTHLASAYRDVMCHWQRGTVHRIGGMGFLAIGGAAYMDAHMTPMGAEITARDVNRCLRYDPVAIDVVISHDCPAGIGVPGTKGFEHYGPPGFQGGDRIAAHVQPTLWLFGHHHAWFDRTIDGIRYCGLPRSWEGYGLLGPDFAFEYVFNPLSPACDYG
ncbi:MAG: hypothetical protein K9N51_08280 [Candidatus Pacebacteria bacterium]|nr:hypothetical protein [Candidatus Paceibacterota bacterium]